MTLRRGLCTSLALFAFAPAFAQTLAREEALAVSSAVSTVTPSSAGAITAQAVERFVDERLAVWQKCLSLDDWKISIVMARRNALKPNTRGQIKWDKHKKSAVIAILDALDYELPVPEMFADMEVTIVHELVHLELASLPRREASRSSEEHAVNRITEALLRLNRQK
ncbi:MAG: hypothetical protein HYX27_08060 [Acidobacteria bacterium]|nr:hypothetical protein [Acidobacteriota bacterium]